MLYFGCGKHTVEEYEKSTGRPGAPFGPCPICAAMISEASLNNYIENRILHIARESRNQALDKNVFGAPARIEELRRLQSALRRREDRIGILSWRELQECNEHTRQFVWACIKRLVDSVATKSGDFENVVMMLEGDYTELLAKAGAQKE